MSKRANKKRHKNCLGMKVNINVEIDTENSQDVNTIEELIELLKQLKDQKNEDS